MLEPVVASIVAWAWLGETFGPSQLVGGAIVLAGDSCWPRQLAEDSASSESVTSRPMRSENTRHAG